MLQYYKRLASTFDMCLIVVYKPYAYLTHSMDPVMLCSTLSCYTARVQHFIATSSSQAKSDLAYLVKMSYEQSSCHLQMQACFFHPVFQSHNFTPLKLKPRIFRICTLHLNTNISILLLIVLHAQITLVPQQTQP